jgi:zinc protease
MSQDRGAPARVEEVVSPGGLVAYLIHEPMLPIVSIACQFRGGAGLDPPGRAGLAAMTANLLDEGAGALDSQAFRQALDDDAINLSIEATRDNWLVSLRTLTPRRQRACELLRWALTKPRFDEEPVARVRSQMQAAVRRRATDPDYVAGRAWREAAFDGHPYAQPIRGSLESLAAITVDELRALGVGRLCRDGLAIGVSGDITASELAPLLDDVFGELPPAVELRVPPPVHVQPGLRISRMPIPQSVVHFGLDGIARRDPDFYAALIANYILGGGGFSSRLLEEIREKRGLAYSAHSRLEVDLAAPLWLGSLATGNEHAALALDLVRQELRRMAAGELDEADLAAARTYLTGSFPLQLTNNNAVARALAGMRGWGLGRDYLDRWATLIEAVTLADVRRVAAILFSRPLMVSIAGDPKGIDPSL